MLKEIHLFQLCVGNENWLCSTISIDSLICTSYMFLNGQIEVQTNESLLFLTVSLKNHNEINIHQVLKLLSFIHMYFLSTSIYDLVLINVCHFHQVLLQSLFKFDHYRDTRAFILDPCIQGISFLLFIKKVPSGVVLTKTKIGGKSSLDIVWFWARIEGVSCKDYDSRIKKEAQRRAPK